MALLAMTSSTRWSSPNSSRSISRRTLIWLSLLISFAMAYDFKMVHPWVTQQYLVYLPAEITAPSKSIFIQPSGLREKAQPASLVSAAPTLANISQQSGTPFYYLSDQPVQAGQQRVAAWLPLNTTKTTGVIIPASALVWHLGQAFVYLQLNNEQFKRIKINEKKLIHSNA